MNRKILTLVSILSLLAAGAIFGANADKPTTADVTVIFDHPEKFTDVKDAYLPTDEGRDAILEQIRQFVVTRAKSYLRDGQKLEVKFTDIDLAGEFEPQRGPRFDNVRIVKEIYFPRLTLEFKLTGADGRVISEGKRELSDQAFQMRLAFPPSDSLRYEKSILDDWLRDELKPGKAAGK
jgi:hypothetical protein